MRSAVETHALSKRFHKLDTYRNLLCSPWQRTEHVAVDSISLQVKPSELFSRLSENGAGKTALIKLLCSSQLPFSGRASVAGYDIGARRSCAMAEVL